MRTCDNGKYIKIWLRAKYLQVNSKSDIQGTCRSVKIVNLSFFFFLNRVNGIFTSKMKKHTSQHCTWNSLSHLINLLLLLTYSGCFPFRNRKIKRMEILANIIRLLLLMFTELVLVDSALYKKKKVRRKFSLVDVIYLKQLSKIKWFLFFGKSLFGDA